MLSFSPDKLFVVGIVALLVLGPNRLPEAARTVGRLLTTVRSLTSGLQGELRDALAEPKQAFDAAVSDAISNDAVSNEAVSNGAVGAESTQAAAHDRTVRIARATRAPDTDASASTNGTASTDELGG